MNIHKNARLTPHGRGEVVREVIELGRPARAVARARGVCERTVRKWVARRRAGEPLTDRSSRPHHSPHASAAAVVLRIEVLRRERRTCDEIATAVGVSRATVARIVARCGWSRLHRRDTVKKAGWEFAHMAVDDTSRFALGEVLPDEGGGTASGFLQRTVRGLRRLGVRVAAVMTDNGSCYRSHRFAAACRRLGLRHLRTRRYTPRTNGKVERFIKTALLEWAYARVYRHSDERRAALGPWLHHYNWHRRRTSLGAQAR